MPARFVRAFLATSVLLLSIVVVTLDSQGNRAGAATVAPRASSTGPQCTFDGSALPLVTGVSSGDR